MSKDKDKDKEKKVRITIDLSGGLYERLIKMESASGATSKADVVRDALRLYEFFVKKHAEGYEFSMRRDGEGAERVLMFMSG
jgi:hypothetical protein